MPKENTMTLKKILHEAKKADRKIEEEYDLQNDIKKHINNQRSKLSEIVWEKERQRDYCKEFSKLLKKNDIILSEFPDLLATKKLCQEVDKMHATMFTNVLKIFT